MLPDHELIHKGNLEITTKIGCSNMCEYCPQVLLINKYKIGKLRVQKDDRFMSVDNFKKFISTIPSDIDFHFTGYVEPFDNPDCDEFLLIAHEKGHKIQINTINTISSYLCKQINLPLPYFWISITHSS